MVKAAAGGGGMGMAVAADEAALRTEYDKVRAFAERMFGDGSVLIERYFPRVRHVEVQILGLADGRVVALGERECSVQRRNQKLVEESPSPGGRRRSCGRGCWPPRSGPARRSATATRAPSSACSTRRTGEFFFLEMNTRLQVEHPVTELVYGIDLVEEQLRVASGLAPTFDPDALRAARARHRAADQRRGPEALPARPRRDHDLGRADRRGRPGRLRLRRRHHRHPVLRLADGQADRPRRRPGRGARPGAGRGGRLRDRRARRTTCRSSPSCWTTPSSSPATTTPASSAGCACDGGDAVGSDVSSMSIREVGPRDGLQNEDPSRPTPRCGCSTRCPAPAYAGSRRCRSCTRRRSRRWPTPTRCGRRRGEADGGALLGAGAEHPGRRSGPSPPASREIEVVVSASDTHNRRNVNRSTDESLDDIAELIDAAARRRRARVEVIVATSFGCPYEGDIDPARVAGIVDRVVARRRRPGRVRRHHRHGARRAGSASCVDRGPRPPRRRAAAAALPQHPGYGAGQHADRAGAGGHRVRRERRRARRLPVRAGSDAATWPPRRSCTCCTTWASTPASTWTR